MFRNIGLSCLVLFAVGCGLSESKMREVAYRNAAETFLKHVDTSIEFQATRPSSDRSNSEIARLKKEFENLPDARHNKRLHASRQQLQSIITLLEYIPSEIKFAEKQSITGSVIDDNCVKPIQLKLLNIQKSALEALAFLQKE